MANSETVLARLDESSGIGRLGRHVHHDPRSWLFPAEMAAQVKDVKHERHGDPFDQGDLGSCTANAGLGALMTEPYYKPGFNFNETDCVDIYTLETELDGFDGSYPPDDTGSDGIGLGRALKRRGLIHSYKHAFGLQHALKALTLRPVCTGVPWYASFDEPLDDGHAQLAIGSGIRGGHEVMVNGIDVENQRVWLINSWGDWGPLNGAFYWTWDEWDQLLQNQGDVMTLGA